MRTTAALIVVAMAWLLTPVSEARARSQNRAAPHSVPLGRIVTIEITDGWRMTGRVTEITPAGVNLKRLDGTTLLVPWEQIVRVILGEMPGQLRSSARTRAKVKPPTSKRVLAWKPSDFYIEYIGLRIAAGGFVKYDPDRFENVIGGFDITLFTLHWRYFYWEIIRGVVSYPIMGVGTSIGVPIRLDSAGRHELRIGAHLTANFAHDWDQTIMGASGAQLYYQYRFQKYFAIHIGLQQYSVPFALALFFGFSM